MRVDEIDKKDKFEGQYQVEDGYVGGSRPHYFTVRARDIDVDETEESLNILYDDLVQEHFTQSISPYGKNRAEFVAWAQEVQRKEREGE